MNPCMFIISLSLPQLCSSSTASFTSTIGTQWSGGSPPPSPPLTGTLSLGSHLSLFLCFAGPVLDKRTQLRNTFLGSVLCYLSQEQKESVHLHTPKIAEN